MARVLVIDDDEELLLKASALGAVEAIMKPFEFRQLVGAVERALTVCCPTGPGRTTDGRRGLDRAAPHAMPRRS